MLGESVLDQLSSDSQLVPIRVAVERGASAEVCGAVDSYVEDRDSEIAALCGAHYEMFFSSVQEAVGMKAGVGALAARVSGLHAAVASAALEATETTAVWDALVAEDASLSTATSALDRCIALVEMVQRVHEDPRTDVLAAAAHVRHVREHVELEDAALRDSLSALVPAVVDHVASQANDAFRSGCKKAGAGTAGVGRWAMGGATPDARGAATVAAWLQCVFEFFYAHVALGTGALAAKTYLASRQAAARRAALPAHLASVTFASQLERALAEAAGFFVLESAVLCAAARRDPTRCVRNHATSFSDIQAIWEPFAVSLRDALTAHWEGDGDTDVGQLLAACEVAGSFCRCMALVVWAGPEEGARTLDTAPLVACLGDSWGSFEQILERQAAGGMRRQLQYAVDEDCDSEAARVVVRSAAERRELSTLGLVSESCGLPHQCLFSPKVVESARILHVTTKHCARYHEAMSARRTGRVGYPHLGVGDATVRVADARPVVERLVRSSVGELSAQLSEGGLDVGSICQLWLDVDALALSCDALDMELAGDCMPATEVAGMQGKAGKPFGEVRGRAQDALFETVRTQLVHFLKMGHRENWAPPSVVQTPHHFVEAMAIYLQQCAAPLSGHPKAVREALFFTACTFVGRNLVAMLESDKVRRINVFGVYNLGVDLKALEACAGGLLPWSCDFKECFSELRQMVSLLISGQPEQYLDAHTRDTSFGHISALRLICVLSKWKESRGGGGSGVDLPHMKLQELERIVGFLQE